MSSPRYCFIDHSFPPYTGWAGKGNKLSEIVFNNAGESVPDISNLKMRLSPIERETHFARWHQPAVL
jgi:hypothetical protein